MSLKVRYLDSSSSTEILSFGNIDDYIEEITIPEQIYAGEEKTVPLITLKGRKKEEKIRVTFIWNDLEVIGVNCKNPNQFIVKTPKKKSEYYLKVHAKSDIKKLRFRPLYLTVDKIKHNIPYLSMFWLYVIMLISTFLTSIYYMRVKNSLDLPILIGVLLGTGGLPLLYEKMEKYLKEYENIGSTSKIIHRGKIAPQKVGIMIKPKKPISTRQRRVRQQPNQS